MLNTLLDEFSQTELLPVDSLLNGSATVAQQNQQGSWSPEKHEIGSIGEEIERSLNPLLYPAHRRRFRKKKDFEEKWLPEEFAGIKKIQRLAKRSSQDTPVSLFHILVPTRTPEAIQRMLLESKQSEKQMETTSTSTTTTTATKAVENASQHHPKTQRTLIKKAQVPTPTKLPLSSRILKYKSPKRLMPMTKALAQEEERRKKCLQLDLFLQKQQETASDEAKEV